MSFDASSLALDEAVTRVLHHPAVASKSFLITIGDRTITGLVARDQMVLTLVCDHRILYGADGAQFLARVKELVREGFYDGNVFHRVGKHERRHGPSKVRTEPSRLDHSA